MSVFNGGQRFQATDLIVIPLIELIKPANMLTSACSIDVIHRWPVPNPHLPKLYPRQLAGVSTVCSLSTVYPPLFMYLLGFYI